MKAKFCYNEIIMVVEQKNASLNNSIIETKKKISVKTLLVLNFLWLAIFVTALTLIINLFKPQWEKIEGNVKSLVNNEQWQAEKTQLKQGEDVEIKKAELSREATQSSLAAIDIDFIEGLVQAILTASESAKIATPAAHF